MIAERVLMSYQDKIKIHCIRPATVCGLSPRMRLDVTVNNLTFQACKNKIITVFGGKQIRPNIHIKDLIRVYKFFLKNKKFKSGFYNAGFENLSILKIAKKIQKIIPSKIKVSKSNDVRSYRQSSQKLLTLGFKKKYSIDDAINEIFDAFTNKKLKENRSYYTVNWMKRLGYIMGEKINLLEKYPQSKRNISDRGLKKTEKDREIARKFDKEFFDGERRHGYGGYNYNPKFWTNVVKTFQNYWNLDSNSSILDIGCGKGFMLYDLKKLIKSNFLKGIDISQYAIDNSLEDIKPCLSVADAKKIPFPDNTFDVVISINTIHNLDKSDCAKALKEISRVTKKFSFITVDAYRNEEEKKRMFDWNLTAKTIMSENEWEIFFKENNYNGDYYWFIP